MYVKCGRLHQGCLKSVPQDDLTRDLVSWNMMLRGSYALHGNGIEALAHFERIREGVELEYHH